MVKTMFSSSLHSILIFSSIVIFIKFQNNILIVFRHKSFILFLLVSYKPIDEMESKYKYSDNSSDNNVSIEKSLLIFKLYTYKLNQTIIPQIK